MDVDRALFGLGMPDDFLETLSDRPEADEETLSRIRQRVLAGARRPQGRPRSTRVWAWVAAALVALGVAGAASPQATLAWVRTVMRFVPGFGLVSSTQVTEGLARPVAVEGPGYTLVVDGVLANARGTQISLQVLGSFYPSPPAARLTDDTGRTYRFQGAQWGETSNWANGTLSFPPLRGTPHTLRLRIAWTPAVYVSIPLVASHGLLSERAFGPATTHHGVSVAARVERLGSQSLVQLLAERVPAGTRAQSFNPMVGPSLAMGTGGTATLQSTPGFAGPLQSFTGPRIGPAVRSVTLTVPTVDLGTTTTVTLHVPVPGRGGIRVDQRFSVGPARVELVRVQRQPKDRLALYFNYPGSAMLAQPGSSGINAFQVGKQGQLLWGSVAIPSGARSLTVQMESPDVVVAGPWRITLPVSKTTP